MLLDEKKCDDRIQISKNEASDYFNIIKNLCTLYSELCSRSFCSEANMVKMHIDRIRKAIVKSSCPHDFELLLSEFSSDILKAVKQETVNTSIPAYQ